MFKELKISTAVVVGNSNCQFDIDSIYSNLEITDEITSLKCNNKQKLKTKEIVCKTFYNQISLTLKNKANIKLFANGKFQVSGVKSEESARESIEYIFNMIKDIKGKIITKPEIYKGLYIYKNKIISVKRGKYTYSNLIKNEKIIINNNLVEVLNFLENLYIQKNHENKIKKIYNRNCDEVGYIEYIMNRKSKNLCLKGSKYDKISDTEYSIKNKYGNEIGIMKITITKNLTFKPFPEQLEIEYDACSSEPKISDIRIANINSNTRFSMPKGQFVDRNLVCSYLKDNDISYIYDPSRYAGIKFSYNLSKVTIFRTGSILLSSKSIDEECYIFLKEMFEKNDFSKTSEHISDEEELSIWDI